MPASSDVAKQIQALQQTRVFQNARQWIDNCTNKHRMCAVNTELQSTLSNLRVIDCTTRSVVAAPHNCRYVALSYVWGADYTYHPLDGTLPQTIEDALVATMVLGFSYLWIDRYVKFSAKSLVQS